MCIFAIYEEESFLGHPTLSLNFDNDDVDTLRSLFVGSGHVCNANQFDDFLYASDTRRDDPYSTQIQYQYTFHADQGQNSIDNLEGILDVLKNAAETVAYGDEELPDTGIVVLMKDTPRPHRSNQM
ncbi:MAG: hypothetical protein Q8R83_10945 [Legionellaceae bacterium]|nr:hypothetical protein [Legionellaceae bacterium]